jgi:single-strand DNA-binding protein
MYLNKAIIIGNLTRDPELKALPSGSKVCNFGMATNRVFKDQKGEKQEAVEWHNIVVFGRVAELVAQYLKKGSQALVEGRIQTRSWEKDGEKKYKTEIIADTVQFGARPGASSASGSGKTAKVEGGPASGEKIEYPQEEINPDDIPF